MIMARNNRKQVQKKVNNHKLNAIKRYNSSRVYRLIEQHSRGRAGSRARSR